MNRTRWCIALLALVLAWPAMAAGAERAYPSRPIHLVVPTAPGGAGDALARESALRLSQALKAPVIVENRPGASGMVGTESVARAAPDGYTLLFVTSATHLIAPAVAPGLARYNAVTDFEPVIDLGYAMSVVMVAQDLPVTTLRELVDYVRAHPDALAYASSGAGSANHLDTEVLASLTGMSLLHVPYKGTADGYRALVAGEVQVMIGAVTSALPHIMAGRVRPLAVMAHARSPLLPAVPTLAELGFGDADVRKWMGIAAPARTPHAIVAMLNAALAHSLASPSMRAWMQKNGFEVAGGTAAEFRRIVIEDEAKWNGIVNRVVREGR